MTQSELCRAVSNVTGESCRTIRARGFSLVELDEHVTEEPQELALECPGCGAEVPLAGRYNELPELAECARCDAAYPFAISELQLPALC